MEPPAVFDIGMIASIGGILSSIFSGDDAGLQQLQEQGLVMGKLGDFTFVMHRNAYRQITKAITADFGSYKPINGQEVLTDSGGYGETITVNGVLVVQPVGALKPLEAYIKARSELRFTTITEDMTVVLTHATFNRSRFYLTGRHRVQSYNLTLKAVYNGIV